MKNETAQEKKERIFALYKKDLEKLARDNGQMRMIVIEYVCSFPKIDPFKMAACLISEKINVVFDDTSISEKENKRKEIAVKKLIA